MKKPYANRIAISWVTDIATKAAVVQNDEPKNFQVRGIFGAGKDGTVAAASSTVDMEYLGRDLVAAHPQMVQSVTPCPIVRPAAQSESRKRFPPRAAARNATTRGNS